MIREQREAERREGRSGAERSRGDEHEPKHEPLARGGTERSRLEQSEGDEDEPIGGGGRRASKVVKAG